METPFHFSSPSHKLLDYGHELFYFKLILILNVSLLTKGNLEVFEKQNEGVTKCFIIETRYEIEWKKLTQESR